MPPRHPRADPMKTPRSAPRPPQKLPATFRAFVQAHPEFGAAHERIAKAVERAGPLDPQSLALVKIGICVGAGLESALRSHVRRARQHGASQAAVEQAILCGMNTIGFPRTVAAWAWAREQFARDAAESDTPRAAPAPSTRRASRRSRR